MATLAEEIRKLLEPMLVEYLGVPGALLSKAFSSIGSKIDFMSTPYYGGSSAATGILGMFDNNIYRLNSNLLDKLNDNINATKSAEIIGRLFIKNEDERKNFINRATSNPLYGWVAGAIDPFELKGASESIAQLALRQARISNASKYAAGGSLRDVVDLSYGKTMSETLHAKLLTDVIGYPKEYHGFGTKDVADLASEIMSATPEAFPFDGKNAEASAEKLKTSIKSMTRALQPLKDIFGKDIKQLLNVLETVTGVNMAATPEMAEAFASRATATMQLTGASVKDIASASQLYQKALTGRAGVEAGAVALSHIQATANMSINYATSADIQRAAGRYLTGTANSEAADDIAAAYALWRANRGSEDDRSVGAFRTALKGLKGDMRDRLMQLAQVNSMIELKAGANLEGYGVARGAGLGSSVASEMNMSEWVGLVKQYGSKYGITNMTVDQLLAVANAREDSEALKLVSGLDAKGLGELRGIMSSVAESMGFAKYGEGRTWLATQGKLMKTQAAVDARAQLIEKLNLHGLGNLNGGRAFLAMFASDKFLDTNSDIWNIGKGILGGAIPDNLGEAVYGSNGLYSGILNDKNNVNRANTVSSALYEYARSWTLQGDESLKKYADMLFAKGGSATTASIEKGANVINAFAKYSKQIESAPAYFKKKNGDVEVKNIVKAIDAAAASERGLTSETFGDAVLDITLKESEGYKKLVTEAKKTADAPKKLAFLNPFLEGDWGKDPDEVIKKFKEHNLDLSTFNMSREAITAQMGSLGIEGLLRKIVDILSNIATKPAKTT